MIKPKNQGTEGQGSQEIQTRKYISGKSKKRGLSKRGLGPKGAIWAKGPFRPFSALSRGCEVWRNWSRSAPKRPQHSAPKRPDFPGRISPRFSLKIWSLSPRLDFPKYSQYYQPKIPVRATSRFTKTIPSTGNLRKIRSLKAFSKSIFASY